MPTLYGLIGYPLAHTFSPAYFKKKFAEEGIPADYKAFPIENINELPELMSSHHNLAGINVTIPYKESIIPYLSETDVAAAAVGAVNCVAIANGRTCGYNTDIIGFEQSLLPLLKEQHTNALVLGTGGAAKAVTYVLRKLGIAYKHVSRSRTQGGLTYDQLSQGVIVHHPLIINTTPVGMYPGIDAAPVLPYKYLGPDHLLYDLIYNPEDTRFLELGSAKGAVTKNGLEMLQLQADASWDIWKQFSK